MESLDCAFSACGLRPAEEDADGAAGGGGGALAAMAMRVYGRVARNFMGRQEHRCLRLKASAPYSNATTGAASAGPSAPAAFDEFFATERRDGAGDVVAVPAAAEGGSEECWRFSLVCRLTCPREMDRKFRLAVMLSCPEVNRGRERLIAGGIFTFRQLQRAFERGGREFTLPLSSNECVGAKVLIRRLATWPSEPLSSQTSGGVLIGTAAPVKEWNPMVRDYVFWKPPGMDEAARVRESYAHMESASSKAAAAAGGSSDKAAAERPPPPPVRTPSAMESILAHSQPGHADPTEPGIAAGPVAATHELTSDLVSVREMAWESRLCIKISHSFLKNLHRSLSDAAQAWATRAEYERVRQGFFVDDAEAYTHDRVRIRIQVMQGRHLQLVLPIEEEDSVEGEGEQRAAASAVSTPSVADDDAASEDETKAEGSSQAMKMWNAQSAKARQGFSVLSSVAMSVASRVREGTLPKMRTLAASPTDEFLDESNPCVAVSLHTDGEPLPMLVGRTNTEYANDNPMFASNAHREACEHNQPRMSFVANSPTQLRDVVGELAPELVCYTPAASVETSSVRFVVMHEEYSIQDGLRLRPWGEATVDLSVIEQVAPTADEHGDCSIEEWVPVIPFHPQSSRRRSAPSPKQEASAPQATDGQEEREGEGEGEGPGGHVDGATTVEQAVEPAAQAEPEPPQPQVYVRVSIARRAVEPRPGSSAVVNRFVDSEIGKRKLSRSGAAGTNSALSQQEQPEAGHRDSTASLGDEPITASTIPSTLYRHSFKKAAAAAKRSSGRFAGGFAAAASTTGAGGGPAAGDEDEETASNPSATGAEPSPSDALILGVQLPTVTSLPHTLPHMGTDDDTIRACYRWLRSIGFFGTDPTAFPTAATEGSVSAALIHAVQADYPLLQQTGRIDVPMPYDWMKTHALQIARHSAVIQRLCDLYAEYFNVGRTFRRSQLKLPLDVQGLPINLHIQLMCVQDGLRDEGDPQFVDQAAMEVLDQITVGACTTHHFGYSRGGLLTLERALMRDKTQLDSLRDQYIGALSNMHSSAAQEHNEPEVQSFRSQAASLMQRMVRTQMDFEEHYAEAGVRRALVVSQILSIAATAFLTKLELMSENHVPSFLAQRWVEHGFLVFFEGLLSVTGKERGMLEDMLVGVSMLSTFCFEIVVKEGDEVVADPTTETQDDDLASDADLTAAASRRPFTRRASQQFPSLSFGADVDMKEDGVLQILLPQPALNLLPDVLCPGTRIAIYPICLNQGIDVKQSLVNTLGDRVEHNVDGPTMQHSVNIRYLSVLEDYCLKVAPIRDLAKSGDATAAAAVRDDDTSNHEDEAPASLSSSAVSNAANIDMPGSSPRAGGQQRASHPLVQRLQWHIVSTATHDKNVDILVEAERVVASLGGAQVTFCKSGKDRTGMAATLTQCRVLGERHGCGLDDLSLSRAAAVMRRYGSRLMVANKNIGRPVFSMNKFQVQFLPQLYRPPPDVVEEIVMSSLNRDTS